MSIHAPTQEQETEALWDRRARLIDHYESLTLEESDETSAKAVPLIAAIHETELDLTRAGEAVEPYGLA